MMSMSVRSSAGECALRACIELGLCLGLRYVAVLGFGWKLDLILRHGIEQVVVHSMQPSQHAQG